MGTSVSGITSLIVACGISLLADLVGSSVAAGSFNAFVVLDHGEAAVHTTMLSLRAGLGGPVPAHGRRRVSGLAEEARYCRR